MKSYLLPQNYFRYMLPESAPKGKKLVYFPYWRFKGVMFSCFESGITNRFMDVSHQALKSMHFPVSVGLRSQALKLKFVAPETPGRFLKPAQPFEEVMEIFERRFDASVSEPLYHRAYIGETLSMIYSPFYLGKKVYDAVLNQPVSPVLPEGFNVEQFPGGRPKWQTRFIPAMCPKCGWDLDGGRDALILSCRNCDSAWRPERTAFKRIKFAHIQAKGDRVAYLPFWRIKAGVSGVDLDSYADLVKIANLPRAVQAGWRDIPFYFWAPAFKIRPKVFLRLANHITLSQPREGMIDKMPASGLYPVTLPVEEAIESMTLNLAGFVKPRKNYLPQLPGIKIKPERVLLVYIPFDERHHELVQPDFGLAVNQNHLRLAENL